MAGPFDLTGQNIENTYQRVLQTPDGTTFYDGTGSLVTFTATANAGGSNTQIQFNSASLLSGSSNFSFNYTTNNVILTGSILMSGSSAIAGVDYIDFDTTASIATSVGRLHWNDIDGTLELGLKGGVVSSEIGQGLVTRVVNKTSPLVDLLAANYQVVVVGGAQGQRLAVKLAQGNNDANSAGTLGFVAEDILRNQEGFIVTVGLLKNRNTTGTLQGETWNDGDILYLSPTVAGQITNIKPQAPNHTVIVGYVEYAHQNNGKIYVKIDNGYEIDELHNVRITTASLTPGQLLVRSGSNNSGVWINSNQLTGSYGLTGSLTATSFTGSLFGTASWAESASQALTASFVPNAFIQGGNSFGTTATLGTNDVQDLAFETNGSTRMFISSSGVVGVNTITPNISTSLHVVGNILFGPTDPFPGSTPYSSIPIRISGSTIIRGGFSVYGVSTTSSITFGSGGTAAWSIRNLGTSSYQITLTGSTPVLTVTSQSRLGVGNTNPTFNLQVSGTVGFPNLTTTSQLNVVTIDTASGQLYYTSSNAFGGGSSVDTSGLVTTSSFNAFTSSINTFTSSYNTGSFSGSFTGSLNGTAATASYYQETDPVFTSKSASLATTGSNNFTGNQTITGSLIHGLDGNIASGEYSHAEGSITKAIGDYSHAEGDNTQAKGNYSHAEGQETMTLASAEYSHAEGYGTTASAKWQHVQGQWNATSSVESAFIVGNGTDNNNRSNLIHAAGNEVQISGSLIATSFTGSLQGTASWAESASQSLTSSYTPNALITASVSSNTITFTKGDTSQFSITVNTGSGGSGPVDTSGLVTTSSFNSFTSSINSFTASYNTGSFTGSFTGSLFGTASWAESASQALTASYVLQAVSASFATTSSFALTYSYTSTSSIIGNGSATSFNINHGFNTRNLHITVYESGSNGETVYPDIRRINENTASIIFANPPTSNQYVVYISQ